MREDKAVLISYLTFTVLGTFEAILAVSWPAMSQDLHVPLEALGVLLLIGLVGFVLVSFNSGVLVRTRSLHWVLLNSIGLRAVGFTAIALFPTWPVVMASVFVMSLGAGGIDSGLNTLISGRGIARQINWLHASYGVGATIGPFIAAGISIAGGGWTWNFAVVATLLVVNAILVWRTAPLWEVSLPAQPGVPRTAARLVDSLRLPMVWISIVLFFLYTCSELTAGSWAFSLFTLGRGMPELTAKFWVGCYWGAFTLSRVVFGLVADRMPLNAALRYALIGTTAGAALLW